MNRYIETANFDIEKFPLDCGTLRGMLDNTAILAVLARIAAGKDTDRLILCGCEDMRNGYRGEGYIWKASEERPLTGEIIYHAEQRMQERFLIEEKTESVNVDGEDYTDLYMHKEANDSSLGTERWAEYTRLDEVSNVALKALIDAEARARTDADKAEAETRASKDAELSRQIALISGVPKGVIMFWDMDNGPIPEGWERYYKAEGRFIMGAEWYTGGHTNCGDKGGKKEITLTEEQMPAHTHDVRVAIPGHTHEISAQRKINVSPNGSGYDVAVVPGSKTGDVPTGTGGFGCSTTEARQASVTESIRGQGKKFEILPPYIKLVVIIKV